MAVRLLSKKEMQKRLAVYGCKPLESLKDGTEVWVTGWGIPFTLSPEGEPHGYDEWQFQRVLAKVIAVTMPPDWHVPSALR
jgi:hypothetical protein